MILTQSAKDAVNSTLRQKGLLRAVREKYLLTLVVGPSSLCNLSCRFCDLHSGRNKRVDSYKGIMSQAIWHKLAEQLKRLGYPIKQLQIHGNGEPLMNKFLMAMVSEVAREKVAESIRVTTNGTMLSPRIVAGLISAGVNEIWVSLDTADRYTYMKFKGEDYCQIVKDNIFDAMLLIERSNNTSLIIKYPVSNPDTAYGVTEDYGESVVDIFKEAAINSKKVHLIGMLVVVMTGGDKNFTTPCEIPFYSLFVKFDGRVSLCCADYKDELTIGDINNESLNEIIEGSRLKEKRMKHLNGDWTGMEICGSCENRTCVNMEEIKEELRRMI
jgi:radical SAM protein with 4Fe4S-binding SPASM domain